ncbi:MAG: beta-galactosidase [Christensenellales bacterium]|jgi:hypothetical protein
MSSLWIRSGHFSLIQGNSHSDLLFPDESGVIRLRLNTPQDWTKYFTAVIELETCATHQVAVRLEFIGENSPLFALHYRVLSNCRVQVPFPIDKRTLAADYAFLPPQPGVFKGGTKGRAIKPEEIHHLDVVICSEYLQSSLFYGLRLTDNWQPKNIQGKPLIDAMGQNIHSEWSGKTHSLEELDVFLRNEREWARTNSVYPKDWSRWGGWMQKRFDATGWFRCDYDGHRWWLVDPDGYAFFSNGMCYGNRTGVYAMADHMENLYEWLPPKEGIYSQCWCTGDAIPQYVVRNGLDAAKKRTLVNIPRANMMRVFGEDWLDAWIEINTARMRRWGVNTLGIGVNDYVDEFTREFLAKSGIPFTITLKYFALTKQCIFRDFPDVYSQEYNQAARTMAERELKPWSNEQGMIGYFVTNEPEWLMHENVNLAVELLKQSGCLASKRALIEYLKKQYPNIKMLNNIWGSSFTSFDCLMKPLETIPVGARIDLEAFHHVLVNQYSVVVSCALHECAPNHLNLGMRYNRPSENTIGGAQKHFDVFSFNCYGAEPATPAAMIGRLLDLPMLVGEWHIGAKDSGLDSWGLYYANNEIERAHALSYYMEQATQEPHLIGIHYFEYNDQPYLGRFDGECYHIGLIDVCNRPYPRTAKAFEDFANRMYLLLNRQLNPSVSPISIKHMT